MPEPQRFRTKKAVACDALREAIVAGQLAPGSAIHLEEWTVRLGVSETPLREALRTLEAQGLVEMQPHHAPRVARQSFDREVESQLMRAALEALGARLAVERTTGERRARLIETVRSLTAEMEAATAAGDVPRVREVNRAIHAEISAASGFSRLVDYVNALWASYPLDTYAFMELRSGEAVQEHRAILAALEAGDAGACEQAMKAHFESAFRTYESLRAARARSVD